MLAATSGVLGFLSRYVQSSKWLFRHVKGRRKATQHLKKLVISTRILFGLFTHVRWQEDEFLKQLATAPQLQHDGHPDWRSIAQRVNDKFPRNKRSAKRCRERYVNMLGSYHGWASCGSLQRSPLICYSASLGSPFWRLPPKSGAS